jgi:hypothetical protein
MDGIKKNNELNVELNIVYRYLRKLGIPKVDAEDAVQEAAYNPYSYSVPSERLCELK